MPIIDFILHVDIHLVNMAQTLGPWLYLILFLIVFAETGLVVTPFLPGDSLLFAVGALTTMPGTPLEVWTVSLLLIVAGILGDATNYSIGRRLGLKALQKGFVPFVKHEHILKTQSFYEKYGGKTIVLARFIPIVRTFAPFVAGIAQMRYRNFAIYNVSGAIIWVALFVGAGHIFGDLPIVKRNFHLVIVAIIILSVLPPIIEILKARRASNNQAPAPLK